MPDLSDCLGESAKGWPGGFVATACNETDSGGWTHTVYTLSPGIPGDSGSAFIDKQGRAFGILSTVAIAPLPASNGVGDLSRELAYLAGHTNFSVTMASGTEKFRGPLLPVP